MGRYNKTGVGVGIGTSGQLDFTNLSLIQKGKDNDSELDLKELEEGIKKLEEAGVKFKKDDVVFVTTSSDNQLVWLEKGNALVGLQHIVNHHEEDFYNKLGIKVEEIPEKVKEIASSWQIISKKIKNIKGRDGYEVIYKKENISFLIAIGLNGFIITAYPYGRFKCT